MGTHPIFESDFDCLTECKMEDSELEDARQEWDQVVQTQHLKIGINSKAQQLRTIDECYQVLINSVNNNYNESELPKSDIFTKRRDLSCFEAVFRSLFGKPTLSEDHIGEAKDVLAMSKGSLSTLETEICYSVLVTLYHGLTGELPFGRFGSHWEIIGFQGNDPATDLRGVGLFGLWLLLEATNFERRMFDQSKLCNFPYCTTLLTLCRTALLLFKDSSLNCYINKSSSHEIIKALFANLHDDFERRWFALSTSQRNVQSAGNISRDIEKNRAKLLKKIKFKTEQ